MNIELREVCKRCNKEGRKNKDGIVIFMNMDTSIKTEDFVEDGIHFTWKGVRKLVDRIK